MSSGLLAGVGACACWALGFLPPRLLVDASAAELVVARYLAYGLIAALACLPALPRLAGRVDATLLRRLLSQVLAGNFAYYFLLAQAIALAGVAATALIIGLLPLVLAVAGRREPDALPLARLRLPLLLALAGVASLSADLYRQAPTPALGLASLGGVALAGGAVAAWTWYALDNARFLRARPDLGDTEWSDLCGIATGLLALLALALLWLWHPSVTRWFAATPAAAAFWAIQAGVALLASWLANALWNRASRRLPLTLAGQLIVFETLFGLLYGLIADARLPRPGEWLGGLLLLGGVLLATNRHADRHAHPRP